LDELGHTVALAENLICARQATSSYSWVKPPRRLHGRMPMRAISSGLAIAWGQWGKRTGPADTTDVGTARCMQNSRTLGVRKSGNPIPPWNTRGSGRRAADIGDSGVGLTRASHRLRAPNLIRRPAGRRHRAEPGWVRRAALTRSVARPHHGRRWAVKQVPGLCPSMLPAEAEGLQALGASATVAVPLVHYAGGQRAGHRCSGTGPAGQSGVLAASGRGHRGSAVEHESRAARLVTR
jgi:hypothetical protein